MRGPVGSRVVAAPMSQHVPVSLRARTAADIIIVYSRCPRGGCCIAPSLLYTPCRVRHSWVKVGSSVSPVRGTRVLDGVLSPRPTPLIAVTVCANAAGCDAHCPTRPNASTPDDRACSSEDFGERRDARKRDDARHHNLVSERGGDCRRSRTQTRTLESRNFGRAD